MSRTAITLENVSKYYKLYDTNAHRLREALHPFGKKYHKEFYALKNINLTISKGEILGVVGKNGSGKSTLLKLVSSVLTPNSGKISVNGRVSALLELGSGFNPEFTGIQNIFFYGTIMGLSRREMEKQLNNILSFADIGEFIYQPLKTYSSGMKARLGFAVAVHTDPEILILDEVLSVGDVLFQRKCYAKMEEFFKGGKTILYVSHSTNSVNELCNRAVLLHEGGIILDADAKTVTDAYQKMLFSEKLTDSAISNVCSNRDVESEAGSETVDPDLSLVNKDESAAPVMYLKDLVSQPNDVNPHIAEFRNVFIYDDLGNKVNILRFGAHYTIKYEVLFKRELNDVSFGTQIRDKKGVVISGVNSYDYLKLTTAEVEMDEVANVKVTFRCILTPGTYILVIFLQDSTGCTAIQYDSYMFKVEENDFTFGGYVLMDQTLEIEYQARGL